MMVKSDRPPRVDPNFFRGIIYASVVSAMLWALIFMLLAWL